MNSTWMMYWWIFIVIIIAQQQQARRRRQMGPRVQVSPEEFLEIARREQGLVIKRRRQMLAPMTYVLRSGDYYYYTVTRQPLSLPPECQVTEAKNILL